jgi:membrane peptidoglycan carboxypeptidase
MGITTWGPGSDKSLGLSLTLGGAEVKPLDMADVYATLANNGLHIPLVAITRIVDADGNILEDYRVPQGEPVLDPRAAYMVTNILSDPAAKLFTYGPNSPLILKDRPSASKTGTTDNYRDTWTDGYTPNLAIVVWVGNTDGHPMQEVLSSMTAGKIWPAAMQASFDYLNLPVEDFARPEGLVERDVCGDTRMRPGAPLCRKDLFMVETAPRGTVSVGPVPANPQAPANQAPAPRPAAPTPAARPAGAAATPAPPPAQPTAAAPAAQPQSQPPQGQGQGQGQGQNQAQGQAQPKPQQQPQQPQPTPKPR